MNRAGLRTAGIVQKWVAGNGRIEGFVTEVGYKNAARAIQEHNGLKDDLDTLAFLRGAHKCMIQENCTQAQIKEVLETLNHLLIYNAPIGPLVASAILTRLLHTGMLDTAENYFKQCTESNIHFSANAIEAYLKHQKSFESCLEICKNITIAPVHHFILLKKALPDTEKALGHLKTLGDVPRKWRFNSFLAQHAPTQQFLEQILKDYKGAWGTAFVVSSMKAAVRLRLYQTGGNILQHYSNKDALPYVQMWYLTRCQGKAVPAMLENKFSRSIRRTEAFEHALDKGKHDKTWVTVANDLIPFLPDPNAAQAVLRTVCDYDTEPRRSPVHDLLLEQPDNVDIMRYGDTIKTVPSDVLIAAVRTLISKSPETAIGTRGFILKHLFPRVSGLGYVDTVDFLAALHPTYGLLELKSAVLNRFQSFSGVWCGRAEVLQKYFTPFYFSHTATRDAVARLVHDVVGMLGVFVPLCVFHFVKTISQLPLKGALQLRFVRALEQPAVGSVVKQLVKQDLTILDGLVMQAKGSTTRVAGPAARLVGDILHAMCNNRENNFHNMSQRELEIILTTCRDTQYETQSLFAHACAAVVVQGAASVETLFLLAELAQCVDDASALKAVYSAMQRTDVSKPVLLFVLSKIPNLTERELKTFGVRITVEGILEDIEDYSLHEYTLLLLCCASLNFRSEKLLSTVEKASVEILERTLNSPVTVSVFLCAFVAIKHVPDIEVLNACDIQLRDPEGKYFKTDESAAIGLLSAVAEFAEPQPRVLKSSLAASLNTFLAKGIREISLDDAAILLAALAKLPATTERNKAIAGVVPVISKVMDKVVEADEVPCKHAAWNVTCVVWALDHLLEDISVLRESVLWFVAWQGNHLSPDQACVIMQSSLSSSAMLESVLDGAELRWQKLATPEMVARISCFLHCSKAGNRGHFKRFMAGMTRGLQENPRSYSPQQIAIVICSGAVLHTFIAKSVLVEHIINSVNLFTDPHELVMCLWGLCVTKAVKSARLCSIICEKLYPRIASLPPSVTSVLLLCCAHVATWPEPIVKALHNNLVQQPDSPTHAVVMDWALQQLGVKCDLATHLRSERSGTWDLARNITPNSTAIGQYLFDITPPLQNPPSASEQHITLYFRRSE